MGFYLIGPLVTLIPLESISSWAIKLYCDDGLLGISPTDVDLVIRSEGAGEKVVDKEVLHAVAEDDAGSGHHAAQRVPDLPYLARQLSGVRLGQICKGATQEHRR
jgi:hypothetical protein